MAVQQRTNVTWTRKHDMPNSPLFPRVSRILYPNNLKEVIEICQTRAPSEFYKAAGSHWALSDAAISDTTFIETHDPNNAFSAMGRTLYEVVPECLNSKFIEVLKNRSFDTDSSGNSRCEYLVHFETGKRIYQLYSELDQGDMSEGRSLANLLKNEHSNVDYSSAWALVTMGGAGGQTVFGALTTGTHGGDFKFPPIADTVKAFHLVADGGKHYWIERENDPDFDGVKMTDDDKLNRVYGGIGNFEIIRDNTIFNAVLISAGRFGIVYSVVMGVVKQYNLHSERRLSTWQEVKSLINSIDFYQYGRLDTDKPITNRFLQIAISLTPHDNFTKNLCGITKHWNVKLGDNPSGRKERCGTIKETFNTKINAPLFTHAGNRHSYTPAEDGSNIAAPPNFLEKACEHNSFIAGAIDSVIEEIEDFLNDNVVAIGGVVAAVAAVGGIGLLALIPILFLFLAFLKALRDWLDENTDTRLGEVLNTLQDKLLSDPDPVKRAAGIYVWQLISYELFKSQQKNLDYEAISYAVMDSHDYLDKSCNVNVDSIEVFFDATSSELITFVDALLVYEKKQEFLGRAFVGYISLRFTSSTQALLGMERWERTCAVEVAGLQDARGTKPLIDFALAFAKDKNLSGVLHWGQRHTQSMSDIQHRFGDTIATPTGDLQLWRAILSQITENGRLNGFSSSFTRFTGLEVVTPIIYSFTINNPSVILGKQVTISWDCFHNPPYTTLRLTTTAPDATSGTVTLTSLRGNKRLKGMQKGTYTIQLIATCTLNGEARRATQVVTVLVV